MQRTWPFMYFTNFLLIKLLFLLLLFSCMVVATATSSDVILVNVNLPVFYIQVFVHIRTDGCPSPRHKVVICSYFADIFFFTKSFDTIIDRSLLFLAHCIRGNAGMHAD